MTSKRDLADTPFQAPEHLLAIAPYVPGKPMTALERELGISDAVKLASNENPLGPSPAAVAAIEDHLGNLHRYPDGACHDLTQKLADKHQLAPEEVVLGNGSDEIIGLLAQTLLGPGDEAIIPSPSFLMYEIAVRSMGASPRFVPLKGLAIDLDQLAAAVGERTRMIFVCNPNNPTGTAISVSAMQAFLDQLPADVVVVVDEAYIEFASDPNCFNCLRDGRGDPRLVALRTFSKAYGLAGLRVGFGVMAMALNDLLHRIRPPFNVNSLAQVAAAAALADDVFLNRSVELVHTGLRQLRADLDNLGLAHHPTQANFFLIDVDRPADLLFQQLLQHGVIVRSMRAYGFDSSIRINVGLPEENARFISALKAVLAEA
ncbi:MAG: histidinol-phosphate transaminase [Desulfosarcinaceae bacterium]|nr:histidinol-phosphate transaminase [Desulfosarcinaceae bacterium]